MVLMAFFPGINNQSFIFDSPIFAGWKAVGLLNAKRRRAVLHEPSRQYINGAWITCTGRYRNNRKHWTASCKVTVATMESPGIAQASANFAINWYIAGETRYPGEIESRVWRGRCSSSCWNGILLNQLEQYIRFTWRSETFIPRSRMR